MSEPASGLLDHDSRSLLRPARSAGLIRHRPIRTLLAVTLSLLGVLAGTVLRSAGGAELAVLGTVVIGTAITVGNVVVPVIIHRDFPARQVGIATGATRQRSTSAPWAAPC